MALFIKRKEHTINATKAELLEALENLNHGVENNFFPGWMTKLARETIAKATTPIKAEPVKVKRCAACRNGEHDNYDDDVRLTVVSDPATGKLVHRAYLCGEHRQAYDYDGFKITIK